MIRFCVFQCLRCFLHIQRGILANLSMANVLVVPASLVAGNHKLLQQLPDSQTFLAMLLSLAEMPEDEAAQQLPEVRAARGLFRSVEAGNRNSVGTAASTLAGPLAGPGWLHTICLFPLTGHGGPSPCFEVSFRHAPY